MDLLRISTAGSVDDGKSTLIGRLLYDSKSIFEDQLDAVRASSERRGDHYLNLALLTDGLRAEREQGITIDVAYRYFTTPKRKFILADTPGHVQYTRNMVTGASTADLALILLDVRNGLTEQTRRHSLIASMIGIQHLLICVNKMDLVEYEESIFHEQCNAYRSLVPQLRSRHIDFIPVSALHGDNIVSRSKEMSWYKGPTLMEYLEQVDVHAFNKDPGFCFPVQHVVRPQSPEFPDYRAYAGRVASGLIQVGDPVRVLPSNLNSRVSAIDLGDHSLFEASQGMSVSIRLEDDIDIGRGDMIIANDAEISVKQEFDIMLCWMADKPLVPGQKYILRNAAREVKAVVREVISKADLNTLRQISGSATVSMNDIARVKVRTTAPLSVTDYFDNRVAGSVILIDEASCNTIAAGMIQIQNDPDDHFLN